MGTANTPQTLTNPKQTTMSYPTANMSNDTFGSKRGGHQNTAAHHPATMPYLTAAFPGSHEASPVTAAHHMAPQGPSDGGMNAMVNQLGSLGLSGNPGGHNGPMPHVMATPDGQLFYTNFGPAGVPTYNYGTIPDAPGGPLMAPYMANGHHPGYAMPYMMPFTPGRASAVMHDRSDTGSKDVPGLDNRRSSYSTTESTPATPFMSNMAARDPAARVAVSDRSSFTTPSPQQMLNAAACPQGKPFFATPIAVDQDLDALLKREPAIPIAVPAVFTPQENMKTLEQSLVNHIPGNKNVYIRGLHPTTDDDLLLKFAERFGKVETSKAIIDTQTGACKGFGFAKFFDVHESESCIRGFYRLGYEVGFARVCDPRMPPKPTRYWEANVDFDQESFNSRLKAEGDTESTNLYISNLPRSLTENELGAIFLGYTILSSKILKDNVGNSRGVGFARFENREICNEIIREFSGLALGDEGLKMQIRYADTPAQKELKRITAERRQFRTNEYNVGAYGTPLVGIHPTIYDQPSWKRPTTGPGALNGRGSSAAAGLRGQRGSMGDRPAQSGVAHTDDAASSEDGSGDEGVTIHVDSSLVANGSTRSSPVKAESQ